MPTMTPRELLDETNVFLLDFDGPLAKLMPPPLNLQAAIAVKSSVGNHLPSQMLNAIDHLAILKSLTGNAAILARAEQAATAIEVECAQTCELSDWLLNLSDYLIRRNVPCAVVSNNSLHAVKSFLGRPDVPLKPTVISARTPTNVNHLKPDPFLLTKALAALTARPEKTTLIGDSPTDIQAARACGVRALGYLTAGKPNSYLDGADAVYCSVNPGKTFDMPE